LLEFACRFCGVFNRFERLFCISCRRRLVPLTVYDLSVDDFAYPGDVDNMHALEGSRIFTGLARRFISGKRDEMLRRWLGDRARLVEQSSKLYEIVKRCGWILGVERLPEVYVAGLPEPNAFTFGDDDNAVLVIDYRMLELLTEDEVTALVAHELTHVKSRHLIYHTLAELMLRGVDIVAPILGVGVVTASLRMLLLAWHRDSEVTADRGALLVVQKPDVLKGLLAKLTGAADGGKVEELFKTHPNFRSRVEKINEFYKSPEYIRAVNKIRRREELNQALAPLCRFCKEPKPVEAFFCPSCGRSQL